MAPPAKKRRTTRAAAKAEAEQEEVQAAQQAEPQQNTEEKEQTQTEPEAAPLPAEPSVKPTTKVAPKPAAPDPEAEPEKPSAADAAAKAKERMARFKALQARAKTSSETNLKEATKESQRLASDPSQLTALHRKHAIASHKLLKADVEDAGEDFERKRAWDWTIDESEKWDKRLKKKAAHRDNNAFRDNHQESNKVYKRQLKNINLDLENYDKQKMAAIEKAAASGGLDIVEMEDGELIAVDKDGSFYSTADSTSFAQNKPDKAAVDRLVEDLRRADEQRLKKRKERMAKNGDEGDVTYINEKNKQFNQKLSRFYDKYTADIRDSFERGTMI
ncbi:SYF2 splicing factor [Purpureocillium lilacinum]|uniref:Pre-mRNA-splicing factor SYF2 n=1 Tax=Purpureocillium lilacinum TaxID=33203 RepID=A0A179H5B2_PURLI|nr:SYF2 splicing factor [Purpureocillium lilacinum]KAK4092429.1 hypothetical protein Purlil1_3050 [Purpureocillium lilacinum]OAQ84619.1 SYF2 splicing factor [Purpureocillium lilacinum]OAQ89159.1 SYF2 splicing factor [Purpureocillium lilacinum]GJN77438.1 pre-mRNA-splicing factor syf2 [Purpureocillium lilacinum]